MTFTEQDYRDKVRSQLEFELKQALIEKPKPIQSSKLPDATYSRSKFLEKYKKWTKIDKEEDERMGITTPKKRNAK